MDMSSRVEMKKGKTDHKMLILFPIHLPFSVLRPEKFLQWKTSPLFAGEASMPLYLLFPLPQVLFTPLYPPPTWRVVPTHPSKHCSDLTHSKVFPHYTHEGVRDPTFVPPLHCACTSVRAPSASVAGLHFGLPR